MRRYVNRKNVQAKSYHTDRFHQRPQTPKFDPTTDEVFAEDVKSLEAKFEIKDAYIEVDQLVVIIDPKDNVAVMTHLRDKCDYTFLSEMSAIDYLEQDGEFEIFYQLLAMKKRKRMRVKCRIKENQAIETLYNVYKSADWAEREMYDMLGVIVNNHPYMKRILMPEDWEGHPLLKTYPLVGDEAAQWYEIDKIFGKEYRDVVGPEVRDTKRIDPKDTKHFARIGHEVPYGEKPVSKPDEEYEDFQEKDGVFLITRFTKKNQTTLKERK